MNTTTVSVACRQHLLDAHRLDLLHEVLAEDPIAIPQQVPRCAVPGEGFTHLLRRPFRRGMCGEQLLERITALNSDPRFLARVQKPSVFGSYVGDADRIGDLDVALQLVRREPDFDKHTEAQ